MHATEIHAAISEDVKLSVLLPNTGENFKVSISIRPYAITLLKKLSQVFELMIFSGSEKSYAKKLIDFLDPDSSIFQHRIYKEHCYELPEGLVKDIRIINRNLSEMVIIDNSPLAYGFQL